MNASDLGLARLNRSDPAEAERAFLRVCGSTAWARRMVAARPFADRSAVLSAAHRAWDALDDEAWLEAFAAHPPIGGSRTAKGRRAGAWSRGEQAAAATQDARLRSALAAAQAAYLERFGYGFLIRAQGVRAEEVLVACRARMDNDPATELRIAAGQERKIGRLRLERLLSEGGDG